MIISVNQLFRQHFLPFLLVTSLAASPTLLAASVSAPADQGTALAQVFHHYEQIRLSLIEDSNKEVTADAAKIHHALKAMADDFDPDALNFKADKADQAKALFPELIAAAAAIEATTNLDSARDAFYELTKPLVRLRSVVTGDLPVVAYCPMAKRSWLQPKGELGNPYYGQSMLTCGSVVEN